MFLPYQMLRNLAPREITAREQREGDEQRGQIAAAVARRSHHVTARVHAMSGLAGRDGPQPTAVRKAGSTRRRAAYRAWHG
jgi:hypothetical protein